MGRLKDFYTDLESRIVDGEDWDQLSNHIQTVLHVSNDEAMRLIQNISQTIDMEEMEAEIQTEAKFG
jgi:hypothetical protein